MGKRLFWLTVILALAYLMLLQSKRQCPLLNSFSKQEASIFKEKKEAQSLEAGLSLLKNRRDKEALAVFETVLLAQPDNLDALWGKAEVLRRNRDYQQAEEILNKILSKTPKHVSSLISLAYIRYKDDRLKESFELVRQALKSGKLYRENRALAYMMLGSINGRRSAKGGFLSKVRYGTRIKFYFLKAKELAPDLPEAHLGLGTFYLLAPAIAGGNLDKAIEELEFAVKIAPDFATVNARLAQAYKKKGLVDKYNFHLGRAEALDPQNEALQEIKQGR